MRVLAANGQKDLTNAHARTDAKGLAKSTTHSCNRHTEGRQADGANVRHNVGHKVDSWNREVPV